MSFVDIIIRMIDQSGNVTNNFSSKLGKVQQEWKKLGIAAAAGAAQFAAAYKIVKDSTQAFEDYAYSVERFANATDMSLSESSKLIQVADDARISQEALERAVKTNADTVNFSVEGLAKLSDEYLALTSTTEKAKFMQDHFGRSWLDFQPLMKMGGALIRENANAMSGALVMTNRMTAQSEALFRAQDKAADATKGMKVAMGEYFAPAMEVGYTYTARLTEKLSEFFVKLADERQISIETSRLLKERGMFTNGIVTATREEVDAIRAEAEANIAAQNATREHTDAMQDQTDAAEEAAKKLQELSDANLEYISGLLSYADKENSYRQSQRGAVEGVADAMQNLTEATHEYGKNSQQAMDAAVDVDRAKERLAEVEKEWRDTTARMVFDMMQANFMADKILSESETKALEEYGKETGLFTEAQAKQYQYFIDLANAKTRGVEQTDQLVNAHDSATNSAEQLLKMEELIEMQLLANRSAAFQFAAALPTASGYGVNVGGGGGGGGGTRKASGTSGWETVPAGYPNDSYPVWMSSGEKYNVQPAGENARSGSGNTYIINNYFPKPETADNATRNALMSLSYLGSDLP